jgi:hypothetical protein
VTEITHPLRELPLSRRDPMDGAAVVANANIIFSDSNVSGVGARGTLLRGRRKFDGGISSRKVGRTSGGLLLRAL